MSDQNTKTKSGRTEIRSAINHDLPNMVVALRGFLEMLRQDEGTRLSEAAELYLSRLFRITDRLQNSLGNLRAIDKLHERRDEPETMQVAELIREAAAAAAPQLRGRRVEFHSVLHVPKLICRRSLMHQALTELIGILVRRTSGSPAHVWFTSQGNEEFVELRLSNCSPIPSSESTQASAIDAASGWRATPTSDFPCEEVEDRLKLVLVDEIARTCRGSLTVLAKTDACCQFRLAAPKLR